MRMITQAEYNLITERILRVSDKTTTILFGAAGLDSLPITIPVNVAMQLASEKNRCLLIDLDTKRNAAAKAFEVSDQTDSNDWRPKSAKTPIQGLTIWPAHNFKKLKNMNLTPLVEAAREKFQYILINAPYLLASPDRDLIANAGQFAVIFTKNAAQAAQLAQVIKSADCKLIANIQLTNPDSDEKSE